MKCCLILLIVLSSCFMVNANAYYYRQLNTLDSPCVNNCQAQDYSNAQAYCQERCAYQHTVTTASPSTTMLENTCQSTCLTNGNDYLTCQARCSQQNIAAPVASISESNCLHYCLANGNNTIFCQQRCYYKE